MGRDSLGKTLVLALALSGCANGSHDDAADDPRSNKRNDDGITNGRVVSALQRAESCDNLLEQIQDDVIAKIDLQAELLRDADNQQSRGPVTGPIGMVPPPIAQPGQAPAGMAGNPNTGAPSESSGDSQGDPSPAPSTPSQGTDDPGKGVGMLGPQDFSKTNNQVEGVDEADIVKSDGTHIYLLHGNQLFVLDSWPADATAMASSATIEGTATEMFVHDGIAAVFSIVNDQGDLIAPAKDEAANGGYSRYYGAPFTKVTLIDVKGEPEVQRELLIEGSYLSARLHGTTARVVVQGGFRTPPLYTANIEYTDPWGRAYEQDAIDQQVDAWRERLAAGVRATELSDWLPIEREIVDGELSEPQRRCTDFYAPGPGLADYGLTNIVALDLTDPNSALSGAIVLGHADQVYANEAVMVLAAADYRFDQRFIQRERSILHTFELDGADTRYRASGVVPGHIADQFSIDERDGVLRVATSVRLWPGFVAPLPELAAAVEEEDGENDVAVLSRTTDNRVVTLRDADGVLERADITEPLGHDGETIVSARFVGDRAYVVTFRRTDPLIVVDVADEENLSVLGELEIPGFSDYMHPIDDGHLLTIGRNTDANGSDLGLMLQIFDVTDATAPRRTHGFRFLDNGYSEANVNHKAFTFHRPIGTPEGQGLLAFPYVSYETSNSTLELFHVSIDEGFEKLGAVEHGSLLQSLCATNGGAQMGIAPVPPSVPIDPAIPPVMPEPSGDLPVGAQPIYIGCVPPEVRRGLFVFGSDGDFVYSISHAGVLVNDMSDLSAPVASVALPYPDYSSHRMTFGTTGAMPPSIGTTPVMPTLPPQATP